MANKGEEEKGRIGVIVAEIDGAARASEEVEDGGDNAAAAEMGSAGLLNSGEEAEVGEEVSTLCDVCTVLLSTADDSLLHCFSSASRVALLCCLPSPLLHCVPSSCTLSRSQYSSPSVVPSLSCVSP